MNNTQKLEKVQKYSQEFVDRLDKEFVLFEDNNNKITISVTGNIEEIVLSGDVIDKNNFLVQLLNNAISQARTKYQSKYQIFLQEELPKLMAV